MWAYSKWWLSRTPSHLVTHHSLFFASWRQRSNSILVFDMRVSISVPALHFFRGINFDRAHGKTMFSSLENDSCQVCQTISSNSERTSCTRFFHTCNTLVLSALVMEGRVWARFWEGRKVKRGREGVVKKCPLRINQIVFGPLFCERQGRPG